MKIAKKFMALALAAVLSVGCAFGVSADGSRMAWQEGNNAYKGCYSSSGRFPGL